ncbi:MAG: ATP-dependent helicase [Clostridia bacterium]|nr:ATP-dependent helicase [Clostridia bacterium]
MTDEQKAFLDAEGKVIVKACPGSGKTYAVAHKLLSYLENWKDYHSGVAVLSFTNVASDEIYGKIKSIKGRSGKVGYPHFIGTVDSFIDEFIVLRYGHLYTAGKVRPRIAISDTWKFPFQYWRSDCYKKRCVDCIEKFYYGINDRFYKEKEEVTCNRKYARMLPCQQYKTLFSKRGIIFQNETALFAYRLLKRHPEIATAIAERFPIIIIDEVQDTSINQMAVIDLLSDSGVRSMLLVGDPDQAIYEWRNANPECFIQKTKDSNWRTIEFTGNFRCSQNICNVASLFSASLNGDTCNNSVGCSKDEKEKPVLLLTNKKTEHKIVDYFLNKCKGMGIELSPKNIAVLTRGRIHSDTDIISLWKSVEIELFAKAAYEWTKGSRNKAYQYAEKACFNIIYNEDLDEYAMKKKILDCTDESVWKDYVIDVLVNMPSIETGIAEWVDKASKSFCKISDNYGYEISIDKDVKSIFKIKQRDSKVSNFRDFPLRKFFEKKTEDKYTRSSIHGVKGETYDAVLINIKSRTGNTITPKLLMEGDLNQELMRLAYVAMTRPRRLLMLAIPNTKGIKDCRRFTEELWVHEVLN